MSIFTQKKLLLGFGIIASAAAAYYYCQGAKAFKPDVSLNSKRALLTSSVAERKAAQTPHPSTKATPVTTSASVKGFPIDYNVICSLQGAITVCFPQLQNASLQVVGSCACPKEDIFKPIHCFFA
eukprot:COSAG01_NODE_1_length_100484_cov_170.446142_11_plen_125_part_00